MKRFFTFLTAAAVLSTCMIFIGCKTTSKDVSGVKQAIPRRIDCSIYSRPWENGMNPGGMNNNPGGRNNTSWPGANWIEFPQGSSSSSCGNRPSHDNDTWIEDNENYTPTASSSSSTSCRISPKVCEETDAFKLVSDGAVYLMVTNNKNAQEIYDMMTGPSVVQEPIQGSPDGFLRTVQFVGQPGEQEFAFRCWKTSVQHFCELLITDMTGNGKKSLKAHYAKDDETEFIIRNDTDYSDSAKPIFEAFPNAQKISVESKKDSQIGWNTCGGQQFIVPESTAGLRILCQNNGDKYFCKFQAKTNFWYGNGTLDK